MNKHLDAAARRRWDAHNGPGSYELSTEAVKVAFRHYESLALLALAASVRKLGLPPELIKACQQAPTISYAVADVLEAIAKESADV